MEKPSRYYVVELIECTCPAPDGDCLCDGPPHSDTRDFETLKAARFYVRKNGGDLMERYGLCTAEDAPGNWDWSDVRVKTP